MIKKYRYEIIFVCLQLFMFYIFPLFAGPTDAMGMVVIILFSTLILSILMGIFSSTKIKILYPIVVSILFIPSVFIYYNGSALIHSIWYLVDSFIGVSVGFVLNKFVK